MATLEELEARLSTLETRVGNIRSCTCDPSNYASATAFENALRKISNLETAIENIPAGEDGQDGADGLTPYIQNGYWWIGTTNTGVKAEGVDGAKGEQGIQGEKGDPYVLTEADKAEIVEDVVAAMPESGGSINHDAIAQVIADLITVGNKTLANALAEWAKSIPNYKLKFTARQLEQKLSDL